MRSNLRTAGAFALTWLVTALGLELGMRAWAGPDRDDPRARAVGFAVIALVLVGSAFLAWPRARKLFRQLRSRAEARKAGFRVDPSFQSVFISYGRPDEPVAAEIARRLAAAGVQTWFYPKDVPFGAQHYRIIREGIDTHDRVLLICSESSLTRAGVIDEIQKVLARETKTGNDEILIPITIDRYLHEAWEPSPSVLRGAILDRVIGDFSDVSDWSSGEVTPRFERLLAALRRPS
jgi:hypothetical protein